MTLVMLLEMVAGAFGFRLGIGTAERGVTYEELRDRSARGAGVLADRHVGRYRDGAELDMHHEMMGLTLDIVAKTLFDSDIEADAAGVGVALNQFVDAFSFLLYPYIEYWGNLPLPPLIRIKQSRETLERIIMKLISERRTTGRDHGDLLSMLIAATDSEHDGGSMSDAQLRDECLTLLLAGHETTARALRRSLDEVFVAQ